MLVICTGFTFTASSIFIRAEKTGSHFLFSLNELDDLLYRLSRLPVFGFGPFGYTWVGFGSVIKFHLLFFFN